MCEKLEVHGERAIALGNKYFWVGMGWIDIVAVRTVGLSLYEKLRAGELKWTDARFDPVWTELDELRQYMTVDSQDKRWNEVLFGDFTFTFIGGFMHPIYRTFFAEQAQHLTYQSFPNNGGDGDAEIVPMDAFVFGNPTSVGTDRMHTLVANLVNTTAFTTNLHPYVPATHPHDVWMQEKIKAASHTFEYFDRIVDANKVQTAGPFTRDYFSGIMTSTDLRTKMDEIFA